MSREHLDRPCEGAWWGQRKALDLLQKTSKNKICMIEATQTLDAILRNSRRKRKKTPLKAYYCDVNGKITYLQARQGVRSREKLSFVELGADRNRAIPRADPRINLVTPTVHLSPIDRILRSLIDIDNQSPQPFTPSGGKRPILVGERENPSLGPARDSLALARRHQA
eukprot:scaffold11699_cov109-Isochrysis_galbana.AAC.7